MVVPRCAGYAARVTRSALLVALFVPAVALAQVSVNQGALDQLKPSAPAASTPAKAAHSRPPVRHAAPVHPARSTRSEQASAPASKPKPAPKPRPVSVAPAPPPAAVLPPVVEVPHAAPPPPPPVPVLPDAVGEATPIPGGVRITFGVGKADLNPATNDALRKIAGDVKADPAIDLNVLAYAAGNADDPSTPRRLSLSRALAARAVLISEGIVSTRIYVRALGATASDGPAERVDVVRGGTAPPAAVVTPPAAAVSSPATPPPAHGTKP
jgi:outer membrane protein OmpA-like peptidoglycan-associated protein